ncbi:MAG: hypothetical protein ACLFRD_11690 [Nitriliruptoraceae bacterium]
MDALNILRAVLVAFAAVVTALLAVQGEWFPAAVMTAGILAHLWLFIHLRIRRRQRTEVDLVSRLG